MTWSLAAALPAIDLTSGPPIQQWSVVGDLLGSSPSSPDYVVEIDNAGAAHLRFGDDSYGARPEPATPFQAKYRVGNGTSGNVGVGAIAHIVWGDTSIGAVDNPIAATGGVDAESIEHVRQSAPFAFRTQLRAVTQADYAGWLDERPDVARAAATFRWTGSWYTVFSSVERKDQGPIVDKFRTELESYLETYRVVGKDLEVDVPRFVSLDIAANVCVKKGYFRGDVEAALVAVFSSQPGGVFDPANFDFGQTVYLSPLYAAAQLVDGVDSIEFTQFEPRGIPSRSGLQSGFITMGRLESARVANDPNFPERGGISFTMQGGQ
jgi:predicted phage baseplate assembly protein